VNHDVASYFVVADGMLDGRKLYVDIFDTNPPAVCFINAFVRALAPAGPASTVLVYHLFVLALGVLGLRVLMRALDGAGRGRLSATLVGLAYAWIPTVGHVTDRSFGQREQLFAILFLPYCFVRIAGVRITRWLGAFMALTGFFATMKPHFILLLGVVEVACLLARRRGAWRAIAYLSGGGLFCALVLVIHSPQSFANLFTRVLPFHLTNAYGHFDGTMTALRGTVELHTCLWLCSAVLVLAIVAHVFGAGGGLERQLAPILTTITILLVLQQKKYWPYHWSIALGCCLVFSASLLAHLIDSAKRRALRRTGQLVLSMAVCLILVVGCKKTAADLNATAWWRSRVMTLEPLLAGNDTIMALSMNPRVHYAGFYFGLRNQREFVHEVYLPGMARARQRGVSREASGLASYVRALRAAIAQERPDVILFGESRFGLPAGTSTHGIVVDDGGLTLAPLGYRRIGALEIRQCCPAAANHVVYLTEK